MEIKIDNDKVQASVNEQINKAIGNSLGSYAVEKAIGEKITEEVTHGVIAESLSCALQGIDTSTLAKKISEEIQRALVSSVSHIIYGGLCEILLRIHDIPSYESEKREKKKAEIMAALKNGIK